MNLINKLMQSILEDAKDAEDQFFVPIGLMAFISFPLFYFLWMHAGGPKTYENLFLRIIAILLSLPLILKNYWPKKLQKFKPVYWYLTLLYIIPFFFTFMLLKNNGSITWQLNSIVVLVLLILLVDWLMMTILSIVGICLGILFYLITTSHPQIPPHFINAIANYIPVLVFCVLFLHRKIKIQKEKYESMKMVAGTIAHELRTPLRTMGLIANRLKRCLPNLLKKAEVVDPDCLALESTADDLDFEVRSSFTFINLLWGNVSDPHVSKEQLKKLSITACVEKAIQRYPFTEKEKQIIYFNKKNDFQFLGDESLMIHILFNLFKNALYYIKSSKKPVIQIWFEQDKNENTLHFKDTGKGIPKKELSHIFDRFYTKTEHGAGIGLAFCQSVMEELDGNITCCAKQGQFTEFILSFPKP